MTPLSHIRNFSIVAHIDHGKSTLADRLIQETNTVSLRDMKEQMLDSMDIERERGITIKAQTVRINYTAHNGEEYVLNLIDTPGHVDFAYEVSRSMRAVEGSLLVVDSTQGVEAQTLANVYHAIDADHEIVPVLNKIDLPASECDRVAEQIEDVIGIDASGAIRVSAKTGQGIHETLEAIVHHLPAPKGTLDAPLKAMLVDSWYDSYLGVIVLVRIMDGVLKKGDRIRMMQNGSVHHVDRIGVFRPVMTEIDVLGPGELGFSPPPSSRCATPVWATQSRMRKRAPTRRCRVSNLRNQLSSAASFPWMPMISKTCATASRNSRSTMHPSASRWRPVRLWALASAAASWGFFTLRSSASGSSASMTST